MFPGAVVPVTVTESRTTRVVGRARHGQRRRALRVGDVPRVRDGRQRDVPPRGEVGREPHERRRGPGERRGRAGGAAVLEADRRERRIGPERRRREVGQLPVLLGDQADAGGERPHPERAARPRPPRRRWRGSARLARPTAPARGGRSPARSAPTDGRRSRRRRSRRRCSGANPGPLGVVALDGRIDDRQGRERRPGRSPAARRAARARGSRRRSPSRWSSVGPPLPTL